MLLSTGKSKEIERDEIDDALKELVSDRRSKPELYLSSFTSSEQTVIIALAQEEPLLKPTGKDFVLKTSLSAAGLRKIINKFEDNAIVYKEDNGYELADPLLKQHILTYRL